MDKQQIEELWRLTEEVRKDLAKLREHIKVMALSETIASPEFREAARLAQED